MTDKLLIELRPNGVLLLTLNRPRQLNAVDKDLEEAFVSTLTSAAARDEVRAVVVAGAGDRAFCAGYDVFEMAARPPDIHRIEQIRQYGNWWTISSFPKPLVTANHALTMGWGAITSVSADIRIGSPSTEFQFTAAPHGGANLTWSLPHLIGWSRALEYLMTSRRIPAEEARECGLLNRIVPREHVKEEALRVADLIASHPPSGVRTIKRLIKEGLGRDQRSQFLAEMSEAQRWHTVGAGNTIAASFRDFLAERSAR